MMKSSHMLKLDTEGANRKLCVSHVDDRLTPGGRKETVQVCDSS